MASFRFLIAWWFSAFDNGSLQKLSRALKWRWFSLLVGMLLLPHIAITDTHFNYSA